jgi:class 3 adenylate cyclase
VGPGEFVAKGFEEPVRVYEVRRCAKNSQRVIDIFNPRLR